MSIHPMEGLAFCTTVFKALTTLPPKIVRIVAKQVAKFPKNSRATLIVFGTLVLSGSTFILGSRDTIGANEHRLLTEQYGNIDNLEPVVPGLLACPSARPVSPLPAPRALVSLLTQAAARDRRSRTG